MRRGDGHACPLRAQSTRRHGGAARRDLTEVIRARRRRPVERLMGP